MSIFDNASAATSHSAVTLVSGRPTTPGEAAFLFTTANGTINPNPGAGWNLFDSTGNVLSMYEQDQAIPATISPSCPLGSASDWTSVLAFFGRKHGLSPTLAQFVALASGFINSNGTNNFGSPNTAGNAILVVIYLNLGILALDGFITDTQGNNYTELGSFFIGGFVTQVVLFLSEKIKAGANTVTYNHTVGSGTGNIKAYEIANLGPLLSLLPILGVG